MLRSGYACFRTPCPEKAMSIQVNFISWSGHLKFLPPFLSAVGSFDLVTSQLHPKPSVSMYCVSRAFHFDSLRFKGIKSSSAIQYDIRVAYMCGSYKRPQQEKDELTTVALMDRK